jgi:Chromo (CHRromatin Organisation MOdifier) domain
MNEKTFNLKTKRRSQKLDSVKVGPYVVEKKLPNDNYKLKLPERVKIHPVFHISLLSKTSNPESTSDEDLTEEYEVEKILDKRIKKGVTEYLIRWKGYESEEDTWEPTNNLNCHEIVTEFERNQKRTSVQCDERKGFQAGRNKQANVARGPTTRHGQWLPGKVRK